jgi:hypothetical protein
MGIRFVSPPLLVVAAIVVGVAAPAAAKSVEVSSNGAHLTAVNANSSKKRGVVNSGNRPQVATPAKGRRPAKVANNGNGSSGAGGSRARSVHRAAKGNSGVNGQRSVAAANVGNGHGSNAQCSSETRKQLESSLAALAGGTGICHMAQESVRLHTALANYHSRCVPGPKGQVRAREYDRAAAQAQETARAKCTTMTLPPSPPSQIPSPPSPRPTGPSRQDRGKSPGIVAVR